MIQLAAIVEQNQILTDARALNNYFVDFVDATNGSIEFESDAVAQSVAIDGFDGTDGTSSTTESPAADAFFADAARKGSILFAAYNDASDDVLEAMDSEVVVAIQDMVNSTRAMLQDIHSDETAGKLMMLAYRILLESSESGSVGEPSGAEGDDGPAAEGDYRSVEGPDADVSGADVSGEDSEGSVSSMPVAYSQW